MSRNLEIKARYPDLAAGRLEAMRLGAVPAGVEIQTDTYFRTSRGRLKLREIDGQGATLIYYERPDCNGARLSTYYLMPVVNAPDMKIALTAALGLRGEVRKRREIYLWHNVRIHFDEVIGLERFIEFEAVLGPDDTQKVARRRLLELAGALRIDAAAQLGFSYADLLGV